MYVFRPWSRTVYDIYGIVTATKKKLNVSLLPNRRILAIDSHPQWSSIGEIQLHRAVHDRYIVQLRVRI